MLLVEHTHNNPTLRTFCQLLLDTQRRPRQDEHQKVPNRHSNSLEKPDTDSGVAQNSDVMLVSVRGNPDEQYSPVVVTYDSGVKPGKARDHAVTSAGAVNIDKHPKLDFHHAPVTGRHLSKPLASSMKKYERHCICDHSMSIYYIRLYSGIMLSIVRVTCRGHVSTAYTLQNALAPAISAVLPARPDSC